MQLLGNEGREDQNTVKAGNFEIKVKKASSLPEGTHPVRFYPLSPLFHEGADYIGIVQSMHWLNKRPIICRRTSYDYTVPDNQNKSLIDTNCVICNDKFLFFKKAKELGYSNKRGAVNSPESIRFHDMGKDLMEKVSASSIVSLLDSNGNLSVPVILRYGKELLDQIQLHAYRIFNSSGVHLCDPAKGYMFEIIVRKNDGDFRTYKDSMPSVNTSPVDITTAPWKWKEVAEAIRTEIMDIPSPDDVYNFYIQNYGDTQGNNGGFAHPAFNSSEGNVVSTGFTPPSNKETVQKENVKFTPPSENRNDVVGFTPPSKEETRGPTPPNNTNDNDTTLSFKSCNAPKLYPCHSLSPGGSGYDVNDSNCKACPQGKHCYENSTPFSAEGDNSQAKLKEGVSFNNSSVEAKLEELNNKMKNNK